MGGGVPRVKPGGVMALSECCLFGGAYANEDTATERVEGRERRRRRRGGRD